MALHKRALTKVLNATDGTTLDLSDADMFSLTDDFFNVLILLKINIIIEVIKMAIKPVMEMYWPSLPRLFIFFFDYCCIWQLLWRFP